jgi:hypothetical protein
VRGAPRVPRAVPARIGCRPRSVARTSNATDAACATTLSDSASAAPPSGFRDRLSQRSAMDVESSHDPSRVACGRARMPRGSRGIPFRTCVRRRMTQRHVEDPRRSPARTCSAACRKSRCGSCASQGMALYPIPLSLQPVGMNHHSMDRNRKQSCVILCDGSRLDAPAARDSRRACGRHGTRKHWRSRRRSSREPTVS